MPASALEIDYGTFYPWGSHHGKGYRFKNLVHCDLSFREEWAVTLLDTLSGKELGMKVRAFDGWTTFNFDFPSVGSALFRLTKVLEE